MNKYVIPFRSSFELTECIIVTNSTSLIVMKMCQRIRISVQHQLIYFLHFSLLNKNGKACLMHICSFPWWWQSSDPLCCGPAHGGSRLACERGLGLGKKGCFPDVHKLIPLWNHYHVLCLMQGSFHILHWMTTELTYFVFMGCCCQTGTVFYT